MKKGTITESTGVKKASKVLKKRQKLSKVPKKRPYVKKRQESQKSSKVSKKHQLRPEGVGGKKCPILIFQHVIELEKNKQDAKNGRLI